MPRPCKFADVVLPPAFWCERDGVYGCSERRYALIEKAIEPPGECRPSVNILVDFALRMGVDPKLVNFKDSAEDLERMAGGGQAHHLQLLRA